MSPDTGRCTAAPLPPANKVRVILGTGNAVMHACEQFPDAIFYISGQPTSANVLSHMPLTVLEAGAQANEIEVEI